MKSLKIQTLIIGAGPAGLAAATSAAQNGQNVVLLDDNPHSGGQIWRQDITHPNSALAQSWLTHITDKHICVMNQTRVITPLESHVLLAETPSETLRLHYEHLILATGARELFLPFPRWTLPGIVGAGGLQALVKSGLPIDGKRIVVAGSGPLLLAVATYLKSQGAIICAIIEQTPWSKLRHFAWHLLRQHKQLKQATHFGWQLRTIPYYAGSWVVEAHGTTHLQAVTIFQSRRGMTMFPCDYLACGFGLVPNTELPIALGCARSSQGIQVNKWQQSNQEEIYCAGEVTGIGGLDLALTEGRIAGLVASGHKEEAQLLFSTRIQATHIATLLEKTFQLRPELKRLAREETLLCRCEDVSYGSVRHYTNWRSAKIQTRCGMGTCQGRICGAATNFLFGWTQDSLRAPLVPTNVANLILSEPSELTTYI